VLVGVGSGGPLAGASHLVGLVIGVVGLEPGPNEPTHVREGSSKWAALLKSRPSETTCQTVLAGSRPARPWST